jgi:hypothetical protein
MTYKPNLQETYVVNGRMTMEGYKLLADMERRITALESENAALTARVAALEVFHP